MMLKYADSEPEDLDFLLKSFLMLLIAECVFVGDTSSQGDSHKTVLLSKARDYMEENISEKISLIDLASDLGVSYSTFKNTFKSQTDCTPVEFLRQLRIRKARFLLGTTSKPIKVIALECGFGTAEYFCNCFKTEAGQTPMEYRAECMNAAPLSSIFKFTFLSFSRPPRSRVSYACRRCRGGPSRRPGHTRCPRW